MWDRQEDFLVLSPLGELNRTQIDLPANAHRLHVQLLVQSVKHLANLLYETSTRRMLRVREGKHQFRLKEEHHLQEHTLLRLQKRVIDLFPLEAR